MNATDIRTPADFPMPDMHCPTWCAADHLADWERHVAVGFDTRRIPAAGGGYLPDDGRATVEEWCTLAYFTSSHFAPLVDDQKTGTLDDSGETWMLHLASSPDEPTHLYIDATGAMTAADTRRMCAHLLEAADRLDELAATP